MVLVPVEAQQMLLVKVLTVSKYDESWLNILGIIFVLFPAGGIGGGLSGKL